MIKAFKTFSKDEIIFRCANRKDAKLIFTFRNSDIIRKQSFNPNKISYQKHIKWFYKKLSSNNSIIIIAENNSNDFIGQIRYDGIKKGLCKVSIFLNPCYIGRGYGSKIIIYTSNIAFDLLNVYTISAYIKEQNIASIKAFTKAGYKIYKTSNLKAFRLIRMQLCKRVFIDSNIFNMQKNIHH